MTNDLKVILEAVNDGRDINKWILSLLALTPQEVKSLTSKDELPIILLIIAQFLSDNDSSKYSKVKFLAEFIKNNTKEEVADNTAKFELEFINSKSITD